MNIQAKIAVILELGKVKIAVPIAISCFTGFILYTPEISWQMFYVVFGIFLIVMGASALNHIQEYKKDALMKRTKFRPIPSGKISISEAVRWSVLFLLTGCAFLAWGGNITSLWIAILSIFWYNLVYTPLKQFTAFAVVPGALSGAFPPWIGWVAAGGDLLAPPILALSFFFFIGQIPHFWLLLMLYGEDYKQAGFKVLIDVFTFSQIRKITLIWMLSTIVVALLLPIFRVISSPILIWSLLFLSLWIIPNSFILLKKDERLNIKKLFLRLNLYFLLVMIMISIDRLYF
ncbi:protoheme IX farnesyltransferase [Marinifilum fragile]|uniref:protoheme IX farnesyltransferase n=1 Tax=Marinifilum fragile TaxID=570161 RepID=UPI0006D28207|nr:protoheme IX farnesyltransferase [Marinifilum fragile]